MKTEKLIMDDRFGEEFKGTYVFQQITWAKRNRILAKHTKYNRKTGAVVSQDLVAIQAETMFASIKEQPTNKPISLKKILSEDEGIPIAMGEIFSKTANKLNAMGGQALRFLLEQLSEESRTQLLQSFGYVKRSDGPPKNSALNRQGP